jgi:hypothetical protein
MAEKIISPAQIAVYQLTKGVTVMLPFFSKTVLKPYLLSRQPQIAVYQLTKSVTVMLPFFSKTVLKPYLLSRQPGAW